MKNPVRTLGAAVVALAAPALFALPSNAQATVTRIETPIAGLSIELASRQQHDFRGPRYNGRNEWGQSEREVRELRRDAFQACRAAVRSEGRRIGFDRVDVADDHWVRQLGPRSFQVNFADVEFQARRRGTGTRVSCEINNGRVVRLDGLPRSPGRGYGPPPYRR